MRGAIRKRFSANAPLLVAVNCAFRAFCFRNPPELLRSVSSSQKVLRALCPRSIATRFFLGALLFLCFSVGSVVATCACIGGAPTGFPEKARAQRAIFWGRSVAACIYIQAHVASPQGILTVQKGIQKYTKVSIVLMPVFFSSKCHEKRQVSRIKTCLSMGYEVSRHLLSAIDGKISLPYFYEVFIDRGSRFRHHLCYGRIAHA